MYVHCTWTHISHTTYINSPEISPINRSKFYLLGWDTDEEAWDQAAALRGARDHHGQGEGGPWVPETATNTGQHTFRNGKVKIGLKIEHFVAYFLFWFSLPLLWFFAATEYFISKQIVHNWKWFSV